MAIPWVLATAMDSSSRTLPPGWEIAVTPAAANAETVSPKGKKASLAATELCAGLLEAGAPGLHFYTEEATTKPCVICVVHDNGQNS